MIRSNRYGTQEWRWYLPRLGLSHGVHGGTRGIGIRGITEYPGTGIHGTADSGGILGTGIRGIGTLGITGHTGATAITGITRTGIITAGGMTDTIPYMGEDGTDMMSTMVRAIPPVHTAREVHPYPAPEASQARPYPETPYPEFPAAGLQGSRR